MAETDPAKRSDKAPISTHPAFPAIVALWFAALLGLGSLVLPGALLETFVAAGGIAAILPAAEPPLGFTARAIVALAGAIVGSGFGLLLARRIARSQGQSMRLDAPERRPISVLDELSEEGLASDDSARRRTFDSADLRRRIALADAPLPIEDYAVTEDSHFEPALESEARSGERESTQPVAAPAGGNAAEDHFAFTAPPPAEPAPAPAAPAPQLAMVPPEHDTVFAPPADGCPLEDLGLVQLAARLEGAIERRRALKAAAAASAASAVPARDVLTDFEAAEAEEAARAMADFFGTGAAAPVRQMPSAMAVWQADEEDDDVAFVASFSLPRSNGHGLSAAEGVEDEFGLEEDETGDGGYSSLLAMKNPFTRQEDFVRGDEPALEAGGFEPPTALAESLSPEATDLALGAFRKPFEAESAEASATPEKPTDSAAPMAGRGVPRGPAETERDLRAALAALQRMSGSA